MQVYGFTFILEQLVDDEDAIDELYAQAGDLYAQAGDVTIVDSDGRTELQFDREASTLDEALRSAWADTQSRGWKVETISVEPASVAMAAGSP